MDSHIATRFLVLSDTHGADLNTKIRDQADVAIHCADLSEESKLDEFKTTIQLLKDIDAPLKLVIAGNHDFTLDTPTFQKKLEELKRSSDDSENDALVQREYGGFGEAKALFESQDAKAAGIVFLEEGIHHFALDNGANLTVFASPDTPSVSDWAFQYDPQQLDYTDSRQRAGSPGLFSAVARARPRMHCFGHVHEGWGAKNVIWRSEISEIPSHFTDIDNDKSTSIETLSSIRPHSLDTPEIASQKERKRKDYGVAGYCKASLSYPSGPQTIFVNAAIQGMGDGAQQLPWIIDIELPTLSQ